jgi:two-component system, LytTR family, response regulator
MQPIKTLIADDEKIAREIMRGLLEQDPEVSVVGEAADGEEALALIRRLKPDIVFLDIHMPILSGLEAVAALPAAQRPHIVFVTAYDQHALKAFELHAVDYVAKPYTDRRVRDALDRAKRRIRAQSFAQTEEAVSRLLEHFQRVKPDVAPTASKAAPLVLKTDGELHFVEQAEIRWSEAQGDYIRIHGRSRNLLTRMTLATALTQLAPDKFVRIHKSTIINRDCVRCLGPTTAWGRTLELEDGTKLNISRGYREAVAQLV